MSIKRLKISFEDDINGIEDIQQFQIIANELNLPVHLKLGGATSLSDLIFAQENNIEGIILPMVETRYSLLKALENIDKVCYTGVISIVLETKTAINNINDLLNECSTIDNVIIGRSDLTNSFNLSSVNSFELNNILKYSIENIKSKSEINVILGGQIDCESVNFLINEKWFKDVDLIETRTVIFNPLELEIQILEKMKIKIPHRIEYYNERILVARQRKYCREQRI